jgi:hypothetical protein
MVKERSHNPVAGIIGKSRPGGIRFLLSRSQMIRPGTVGLLGLSSIKEKSVPREAMADCITLYFSVISRRGKENI